jgi:hypothetical protein
MLTRIECPRCGVRAGYRHLRYLCRICDRQTGQAAARAARSKRTRAPYRKGDPDGRRPHGPAPARAQVAPSEATLPGLPWPDADRATHRDGADTETATDLDLLGLRGRGPAPVRPRPIGTQRQAVRADEQHLQMVRAPTAATGADQPAAVLQRDVRGQGTTGGRAAAAPRPGPPQGRDLPTLYCNGCGQPYRPRERSQRTCGRTCWALIATWPVTTPQTAPMGRQLQVLQHLRAHGGHTSLEDLAQHLYADTGPAALHATRVTISRLRTHWGPRGIQVDWVRAHPTDPRRLTGCALISDGPLRLV